MQNTIVLGEYTDTIGGDRLENEVAPGILGAFTTVSAINGFRRLDGDETYARWLVVELDQAYQASAVAAALSETAQRAQAYHEVFRMNRDPWRVGRRISSFEALDTAPETILTVVLPVADGRDVEWNQWYDYHHMPTVLGIAPGIEVGHRFTPVSSPTDGTYLVIYEFPERADLDAWQTGSTVTAKHDEYAQMWGVRNVRRAFTREFRTTRG